MNAVLEAPAEITPELVERRESDWLLVTAPLEAHDGRLPRPEPTSETLLAWNAALPGAAKFVFTSELRVALQAELPCNEVVVADCLHTSTVRGLSVARNLWQEIGPAINVAAWPTPAAPSLELTQALAEADWPAARQTDNSLLVELDVTERRAQAQVAELAGGAILIWSELIAWPETSVAARQALARLLLFAGGNLRWARPAVYAIAGGQAAGFEILLPSVPTAAELATALGALSVGCQLCAAEITSLLDESVALEFLQATNPVPFRVTSK